MRHHNAPAHKLQRRLWETVDSNNCRPHPVCPDLFPCDFHPFPNLKGYLRMKHFENDNELKTATMVKGGKTTCYLWGIEKLRERYNKCIATMLKNKVISILLLFVD